MSFNDLKYAILCAINIYLIVNGIEHIAEKIILSLH
mgnify:CR=1 FL=1